MPENVLNPAPEDQQNNEQNEDRFVSDTQKVVRRHLENEDDIITEEDIRNVRVGMTPSLEPIEENEITNRDEKVADHKTDDESETVPGSQKITPWDVVDSDE